MVLFVTLAVVAATGGPVAGPSSSATPATMSPVVVTGFTVGGAFPVVTVRCADYGLETGSEAGLRQLVAGAQLVRQSAPVALTPDLVELQAVALRRVAELTPPLQGLAPWPRTRGPESTLLISSLWTPD